VWAAAEATAPQSVAAPAIPRTSSVHSGFSTDPACGADIPSIKTSSIIYSSEQVTGGFFVVVWGFLFVSLGFFTAAFQQLSGTAPTQTFRLEETETASRPKVAVLPAQELLGSCSSTRAVTSRCSTLLTPQSYEHPFQMKLGGENKAIISLQGAYTTDLGRKESRQEEPRSS